MVSIANLNIALMLMPSSQGSIDFSILAGGASAGGGASVDAGSVHVALANAEKNEARQREQIARDPVVRKELERFAKVVKEAGTIEDVLDDPTARRVFLKANGLGDQADAVALAKKVFTADLGEPDALPYKMASVNNNWLSTAKKYDFATVGVELLKLDISIKEVADNYVGEKRLDMLDEQLPGLGSALLFKQIAKDLDTPIKILGSALGRDVVTTALGLPKQIAVQSLEAQMKAVSQRLDAKKLKDPEFVDKLVQRYLIQLNGGMSGLTV